MDTKDLKRLLFCRVEWMKNYRGLSGDRLVYPAGGYARKYKYGMEYWNFLAYRGQLHGFVQHRTSPIVDRIAKTLGKNKHQQSIKNATVVWVATRNNNAAETYIVGWWRNATIHRESRAHPYEEKIKSDIRQHNYELHDDPTYFITCREMDTYLVPDSERVFQIPRGRGWMGHRSLVWYADGSGNGNVEEHLRFKKSVGAYIVGLSSSGAVDLFPELNGIEYEEGRKKFIAHHSRERNQSATRRAKREFQSRHEGRLFCQAYELDFYQHYGEIGESFIEAHHVLPLGIGESRITKSTDFIMLCSNCHRMVHRLISRINRAVNKGEIEQLMDPDFISELLSRGGCKSRVARVTG